MLHVNLDTNHDTAKRSNLNLRKYLETQAFHELQKKAFLLKMSLKTYLRIHILPL